MDPGPRAIDIYARFSNAQERRMFSGWAFLTSTSYLGHLQLKGWRRTRKLNIHLTNESDNDFQCNGGILNVRIPFDYAAYLTAELEEQRLLIREVLHQAMLSCSKHMNWPSEVLTAAYSNTASLATELVFESKLVRSPDRQHYASVVRVLNHQYTLITVRFRDSAKRIINEVELITSFQHPLFYDALLRKREWQSNNAFAVGISSGELWISASLDKATSTVQLFASKNSAEELNGILRMATYREITSQTDYVAWANQ